MGGHNAVTIVIEDADNVTVNLAITNLVGGPKELDEVDDLLARILSEPVIEDVVAVSPKRSKTR